MKTGKQVLVMLLIVTLAIAGVFLVQAKDTVDSPFSIEISTDKSSYKTTNIAKISVKVTNTSKGAVKSVSAEALFDGLSPVGKNNTLKAEANTLNPGESLSLNYSAMINSNHRGLNFIQKIILYFKHVFNRVVSVSENGFNDGRAFAEERNTITFGKLETANTIRVWYTKSSGTTPITTSDDYKELIRDVDIDEIYDYDENDISYDNESGNEFINNILLIIFDENCSDQRKADVINSIDGKVVGGRQWANELQIEIQPCSLNELKQKCSDLNQVDGVVDADYDLVCSLDDKFVVTPNDPYLVDKDFNTEFNCFPYSWNKFGFTLSRNWYHLAIETVGAWSYEDYFDNINIGIIDSGFQLNHEDLSIQLASKENLLKNHGTHVAGLIGAKRNNGKGLAGIINKSTIFGYAGDGKLSYSKVYKGLDDLVRNKKCKVINLSQGDTVFEFDEHLYKSDKKYEWFLTTALTEDDIAARGTRASKEIALLLKNKEDFVIIQCAGNGADNTNTGIRADSNGYFCAINEENCYKKEKSVSVSDILDRVIIVASATKIGDNYQVSKFSNGGPNVEIAAPGELIYSTVAGVYQTDNNGKVMVHNGQKYATLDGTSMAAPIVSGVAGLVWSVNQELNGSDVKRILVNSAKQRRLIAADNPDSPTAGDVPLVNAKLAVQQAMNETYSTSTVIGKVIDKKSNEPLSGVEIQINNLNDNKTISTQTDDNGTFSVLVPIGNYEISFSKDGYIATKVSSSGVVNGIVDLGNIMITAQMFAGGTGTEDDPYLVANAEQLNRVRDYPSSSFLQTKDIDLSQFESWNPIGFGLTFISTTHFISLEESVFSGSYDGNGFKIKNLCINRTNDNPFSDCYGLFGVVTDASLSNIILEDVNISLDRGNVDYEYLWSSVGDATITVGGIVGWPKNKTEITNCSVSGFIFVDHCNNAIVGGISGCGAPGYCKNYATIKVNADRSSRDKASSNVYCGGITGYTPAIRSYLTNNINYGSISALAGQSLYLGGITGMYGKIHNCVNVGNLQGETLKTEGWTSLGTFASVGGIAGYLSGMDDNEEPYYLKNCINYGNISFHYTESAHAAPPLKVGGLCGNTGAFGYNCFNLNQYIHASTSRINITPGSERYAAGCCWSKVYWTNGDKTSKNVYALNTTEILINGMIGSNSGYLSNEVADLHVVESEYIGTDITKEEALQEDLYKGFDFENTWIMNEAIGGPVLR